MPQQSNQERQSRVSIVEALPTAPPDESSGQHDGGTRSGGDEEEKFDALHSVRVTVLSRLVECMRFTSGPAYLNRPVNLETLLSAFKDHAEMVNDSLDSKRKSSKHIRRMWITMERNCRQPLPADITFGYLFDFEFPMFPETTAESRERLRGLAATQEMVSRSHVMETLACEPDDQVLDFIFASGAQVLPSEVFSEVISCLDRHPIMVQFTQRFVASVAERGKRMQPFAFYIALLIAILVVTPQMSPREHHAVHENIMHFGDNDFETGCPAAAGMAQSAVAPETCSLLGKSFYKIAKPDLDVMQYARRQIVLDLWPKSDELIALNKTAAEVPLGNVQLVGSLLIRYVNQTTAFTAKDEEGCRAMRLSRRTPHFEINGFYECNSIWSVSIPFNVTREEALAMARAGVADLPATAQPTHTAIIIQFVAFAPQRATVAHAQFILSLPRGGGVVPRAHVSVMSEDIAALLLPIVVIKILGTVWEVIWVVVFAFAHVPWYDDWAFYADIATTLVGIAAYAALRSVNAARIDQIAQGGFFPEDVDRMADVYNAGMSITGFFFILCILCLLRFARDIHGLDFLYSILRTAMIEILATVGIFIVWCFGFVAVGMLLLGDTVEQYSSLRLAWQTLMLFFFHSDDYDNTTENSPVAGMIFFFLYSVFVVFFALNVLVAIITAPLTLIRGQRSAMEGALDQVYAKLPPDSSRPIFVLKRYIVWPFLNVVMCSIPLFKNRWYHMQCAMHTFYAPTGILATRDSIVNASRIIRLIFGNNSVAAVVADELTSSASTVFASSGGNPLTPSASVSAHSPQGTAGDFFGGSPSLMHSSGEASAAFGNLVGLDGSFAPRTVLAANGWDSPLVQLVVSEALIYPDSTLALVLGCIAAECPLTVVRDARLLLALEQFSDFDADVKQVMRLQESLMQACAQQQENALNLLEAPNRQFFNGPRSRRASAAADDFDVVGGQPSGATVDRRRSLRQIASGTIKPSASTGGASQLDAAVPIIRVGTVSSGVHGDDVAVSSDEDAPAARMDNAGSGLFGSEAPRLNQMTSGLFASAAAPGSSAPPSPMSATKIPGSYFFLGILDARISNSNQFLFYAITTLVFTFYYFVPFFAHEDDTAWLTRSLHAQLRYGDMLTSCGGSPSCNGSLTFNKTFEDTGDLEEFDEYLREGFGQFLWYRQLHSLPGGEKSSLWWDSRIELRGPVRVRQLRARVSNCSNAKTREVLARRGMSRADVECFATEDESDNARFDHRFTSATPIDAAASSPAPYPDPAAFTYIASCSDAVRDRFRGELADYPCEGFEVLIHNHTQLLTLLDSRWFDARTVLASVTGDYYYGNDTAVRYTLIVEFSHDEGGAKPRVFASLLKSSAELRTLTDRLAIVYVVVVAHALWWVLLQLRYLFRRYVTKLPLEACILLRPEFPLATFVMLSWLILSTNAIFPDPADPNHELAVGMSTVVYIMITFSTQNVFPAASLVSKEVLTLVVTLFQAVVQVFYVLPFFLVFMTAFATGGVVMFGRMVPEFSTARWAFLQISLFTFTDSFDMHVMQRGRPQEAQIYGVLMLFSILITLNNVFLAIVTSACGDAQFTLGNVGLSELLLRHYNYHVIYGKFVGFVLKLMRFVADNDDDDDGAVELAAGSKAPPNMSSIVINVVQQRVASPTRRLIARLLRFLLPRMFWAPRPLEIAKCTGNGRILFPVESVLSTFPPVRANELLRHMRHRKASKLAFAAMLPFVLDTHNEYRSKYPKRAADDDVATRTTEAAAAARIIAIRPPPPERVVRPSLSMVFGSGVFTNGGGSMASFGTGAAATPFSTASTSRSGGAATAASARDHQPAAPMIQVNGTVSSPPRGGTGSAPAPLQPSVIFEITSDGSITFTGGGESTMSSAGYNSTEAGWAVFKKHCREAGVSLSNDLWQRLKSCSMDDNTKLTLMEVFDEMFDTLDMYRNMKQPSTYLTSGTVFSGGGGGGSSAGSGASDTSRSGKRKRGQTRRNKQKKLNFGNVLV